MYNLSPLSTNTAPPACTPFCSPLASHGTTRLHTPRLTLRLHTPTPLTPRIARLALRLSVRPSPHLVPPCSPLLHPTSCRHLRPSPHLVPPPSPLAASPHTAPLTSCRSVRPSVRLALRLTRHRPPRAATFAPRLTSCRHLHPQTPHQTAPSQHRRQPYYRVIVAWLPPCPFCTFRRSVCYRVIFAYRPPRTPALSLLRIRHSPFGDGCAFCTTIAQPPPLHPTLHPSHRWQSCVVPKATVVYHVIFTRLPPFLFPPTTKKVEGWYPRHRTTPPLFFFSFLLPL